MPSEGPGERYSVLATKTTGHGLPVVEKNHAGFAAKSSQALPAYPSVANAAAAQVIASGEEMVIMLTGLHDVATSLLPGGAAEGDGVYIVKATNALALAATALTSGLLNATHAKLGVISTIDTTLARASINLNLKGAL